MTLRRYLQKLGVAGVAAVLFLLCLVSWLALPRDREYALEAVTTSARFTGAASTDRTFRLADVARVIDGGGKVRLLPDESGEIELRLARRPVIDVLSPSAGGLVIRMVELDGRSVAIRPFRADIPGTPSRVPEAPGAPDKSAVILEVGDAIVFSEAGRLGLDPLPLDLGSIVAGNGDRLMVSTLSYRVTERHHIKWLARQVGPVVILSTDLRDIQKIYLSDEAGDAASGTTHIDAVAEPASGFRVLQTVTGGRIELAIDRGDDIERVAPDVVARIWADPALALLAGFVGLLSAIGGAHSWLMRKRDA